jgi:hypothetical protein
LTLNHDTMSWRRSPDTLSHDSTRFDDHGEKKERDSVGKDDDEPNRPIREGDDEEANRQDGPPTPVGFWDPMLKNTRKEVFSKWLLTSMRLVKIHPSSY